MNSETFDAENFDAAINELIPRVRPTESVHPISSNKFENPKKKIPSLNLEVNDSYNEFAWEFLRRNRFYQAMRDKRKGCLPVEQWGFRWLKKLDRTHGLNHLKPYWESYSENSPPMWEGLEGFAERLPQEAIDTPRTITITLKPGQVAIVFDVGGMIDGQSPCEIQGTIALTRLRHISESFFSTTPISGKPQHRTALLRKLRLFDLLSANRPINLAAAELKYRRKRSSPKQDTDSPSPFTPPDWLVGNKEPITTAYEDANAAYQLVYRHEYIGLLRGERNYQSVGNQLIPYAKFYKEREANDDWQDFIL